MKKAMILRRILTSLLFAAMLCSAALADTPAPTMAPTSVPVPPGLSIYISRYGMHDKLPIFKDNLYRLGYYTEMSSDENIRSLFLDDETMNAVFRACMQNGLNAEYHDEGINSMIWDAVMNSMLAPAGVTPSPAPIVYQNISWHTQSEAVRNIQIRLMDLGYYLAEGATGLYADDLRQAIDVYCSINGLTYDQAGNGGTTGITDWLQKRILEEESIPYHEGPTPTPTVTATPSPVPAKCLGDKMRDHFSGSTSLLGIQVSNIVVWLICFGLIAVCIIAAIYFFSPADANSKRAGSTGITRRKVGSYGNDLLEFTIEYQGIVTSCRCKIDHALKIGRGVGSFPLNMQDREISRKHCEIYYSHSGNDLMLRDYSSNATYVNGRRYHREECMLQSGDVIQIGSHRITIHF